jgi:CRISPR-associated protein (TIGR02584 family)
MPLARAEEHQRDTILLALSGLSPAVLSESVWALAHENPPIIPARVVVITTRRGSEAIRRDLLASGVWERLRATLLAPPRLLRFGSSSASIRLLPAPMGVDDADDIATSTGSACAGDFILDTLRQFTENPDVRVVFSIAGGRKTMAVLGALAMTLLGRPADRLCHVLVNPPFDSPGLVPRFAFPDPTVAHYSLAGTVVPAGDARITLCDIPYVRVRQLFVEHLDVLPGTFTNLVDRANRCVALSPRQPRVLLDPARFLCSVQGVDIALSVSEYLMFWMLCDRAWRGEARIVGCERLAEQLTAFDCAVTPERMPAKLHWVDSSFIEDRERVRRLASRLRLKLKEVLGRFPSWPLVDPVPVRGEYGLLASSSAIQIVACGP